MLAPLEHLKYDVTALAHYLRTETSVLVIGVGGGRDILTVSGVWPASRDRRRDQSGHTAGF